MGRAGGVWIVRKSFFIVGAFTVKHELISWLEKVQYTLPIEEMSIVRTFDGQPDFTKGYFSAKDFLNG